MRYLKDICDIYTLMIESVNIIDFTDVSFLDSKTLYRQIDWVTADSVISNGSGRMPDSHNMVDYYTQKDGFLGMGVFDDSNTERSLQGYCLGYKIDRDEIEEIRDAFSDPSVYTIDPNIDFDTLIHQNIFYIDTLVVDDRYKMAVYSLLTQFLSKLRSLGYTYIMFYGQTNTEKLFFRDNLIKSDRLQKFGLYPVLITKPASNEMLGIFKLK